jgi:hypothetical protein
MNTHLRLLFAVALLAGLVAGCASSPVGQPTAYPTTGQAVVLAGETAGGAFLGNSINNKIGGPIGAVVGIGAGLLTNKYLTDNERQAYAEGYEEGAREARANMLKQYWEEKTTEKRSAGGAADTPAPVETSYNAGVVDGVRLGPRTAAAQELTEPIR